MPLTDPRKARDTMLQPISMVRIQLVIQLSARPGRVGVNESWQNGAERLSVLQADYRSV